MVSLIEANIDLIADALETVESEVDRLSREVFRNKTSNATKKTRNLQSTIEQIGRKGDLLPMIRESLVSVARHVAYYSALGARPQRTNKATKQADLATAKAEHQRQSDAYTEASERWRGYARVITGLKEHAEFYLHFRRPQ
jgi:Mg2+ and Co2+ transporter CorA